MSRSHDAPGRGAVPVDGPGVDVGYGRRGLPRWVIPRRRFRAALVVLAPLGFLLFATLVALRPQLVTSYPPNQQDLVARLGPPGFVDEAGGIHALGTDTLGRDELSRLAYGARSSLTIGYAGVALGVVAGTMLGVIAGYCGGWAERAVIGVVDVYLSFPYVLIAIVWATFMGTTLPMLILIVAVRGWVEFARVVRAQVLSIKEREFVAAARSMGAGDGRVMRRHILPHVVSSLFVLSGFQLGRLILLEATLSFLGLGLRPPTPSWGGMLADGRLSMFNAWWVVACPSLAISLLVLSANLLGDGLRDLLDPALEHAR